MEKVNGIRAFNPPGIGDKFGLQRFQFSAIFRLIYFFEPPYAQVNEPGTDRYQNRRRFMNAEDLKDEADSQTNGHCDPQAF